MGKLLLAKMDFGSGTEVFAGSQLKTPALARPPGAEVGGDAGLQVARWDRVFQLP